MSVCSIKAIGVRSARQRFDEHESGSEPGLCDACFDYARGRAEERAAVVAWLRDTRSDYFGVDKAIERGDHEVKR